ncbi:hypothetical protein O1D87_003466 [Vibrio cholerae]|uniref:hypothetical protein n=1 Tax=Vibrio TaxID=662 RepID=UPI00111FB28F|nr:hypothetical protein [Vibrio parahaemolyticus]EHH1191833.1 hypothetical protein [Vibrio vulnificus]EKG0039214.1 hypothetical protein [Vibrio cholerae]EIU7597663.1 hypothetical protein [Vibrio vulnificus]EJE8535932.1 hypothetical protein [Vibrio vulnificus]TPA68726.1 hypothetical protein DXJ77_24815 [Vibrio parahaemolyticus]
MKELVLDWQFWSAFFAFVAIILSQFPPMRTWFKGKKAELEKTPYVTLSHKVGNPNVSLFIILKNVGSQTLAVKKIRAVFKRDNEEVFTLNAGGYLRNQNDAFYTMFTPFDLKVDEVWAHTVNLNEYWSRKQQQRYREIESEIRNSIFTSQSGATPEVGKLYEASIDSQIAISEFFKENFKWDNGDYSVELEVLSENDTVLIKDYFRFVLYESESKALADYQSDYKYGAGVYYNSPKHTGIVVEISH